ncbi:CDP-alcohol phosphatidyltransferase family protein [Reichenbachiella ulvae]|uniref:CDP-alcohol phosphatidyltransferase family protein n=1 Tax=Reichenbachiella ulvae TaxID=2980104 RepID=A0ABT3CU72_9BACT|nr:CDP-alcohol phosphatidyltransferase family protein [Reichenbachiella ulvae]MCV9387250.1 CDP-alcohol phosphatidyltransferase family protein [Reichenbachiella ulvae]
MNIISRIRQDFRKSYQSIKLPQVEETFDIYFSRFFGYYFAVLAKRMSLTPNQVSLSSLFFGLIAGVLFYFQENFTLMMTACFLITLAGLLDSADGQLARMTGQSSEFGRKVDALIDILVFSAAYLGGLFYFFHHGYGWWIVPLAVGAGYFHSIKSAVYEFYKTEFIYYLNEGKGCHRVSYIEEVMANPPKKGIGLKIMHYMEIDYIQKQAMFQGRKRAVREQFEQWALGKESAKFKDKYNKIQTSILTWWALVGGTNVHRTALMVCSLFGRMDIYFFFSISITVFLIPIAIWQNSLDRRLIEEMK